MIVDCSKRPDGWIPVKGNEKEICEHLLKHNYYEECSVERDGNDFDCYLNDKFDEVYFDNEDNYFVKLNDDGIISVSTGKPSFKYYVAMEFNLTDDFDWVKWLLNAPNCKSFHKNLITKEWFISSLPFRIQEGSILIFNKNSKTLHNVLNRTCGDINDTLWGNGYAVHGNSINKEIYDLEKRLLTNIYPEERIVITSRIRLLKNMKGYNYEY
nr:MAG TPA: hypothetical protein [Caudoviricetes sp.]